MASSDKDTTLPQSNTVAGSPVFEGKECDLLLTEYNTLRTELLQRVSTRDQIVFLSLTVFGTFLGFTAFGSNAIYLIKIEEYVSRNSTADVGNLFRWQTTYDEQKYKAEQSQKWPPSATVIFPLTATAALSYGALLFFVEPGFNPIVTWVLMIFAVLCSVVSWIVQLQKTPVFRL